MTLNMTLFFQEKWDKFSSFSSFSKFNKTYLMNERYLEIILNDKDTLLASCNSVFESDIDNIKGF